MTTPNTQDNVPGTEYLVDTNHSLDVSHAGSGSSDIVLLPQPTGCGRDPLVSLNIYKMYTGVCADGRSALVHAQEIPSTNNPRFIRLWLLVRREQPWCCTYRHQSRGQCASDCFGGRRCIELPAIGK
jgi:hypothetical protein